MKLEFGSNSQAGQESFVLNTLNRKRDGFYLEIGGYHSKDLSNTFLLETRYGWRGVSIEISSVRATEFRKNRLNPLIEGDATVIDYQKLLGEVGAPSIIDYLQVDIEPARNSFKALMKVLSSSYIFSTITFEHDLYDSRINWIYKNIAYYRLKRKGYIRVASNVSNGGNAFEDWYIHESLPTSKEELPNNSEWRIFFTH